jgi:hypothetical protein
VKRGSLALRAAALELAVVLWLGACAATSNPSGGEVKPVVPPPKAPEAQAPPAAGAEPGAVEAAAEPAAPTPATEGLPIGMVGGEAIDASALLERLWMRDSQTARELFEFLVMSRISLFEADRLGVRLDPALVDVKVQTTLAAVTERLRKNGSRLTLDQHVQRELEISRESYDRKVRADAVMQLLTERCVRAWYLESPRVELQLMELASEEALKAAQSALAAGQSFEEVAAAHGMAEDAAQGGMRVTMVRSEESDLARLAFVTPLGEVGGPIVREQHFLLVKPVKRPPVVEGRWSEVGPAVEASLAETALDSDKMEFVQWRAAMVRRYPIDLAPFLDLVEGTVP